MSFCNESATRHSFSSPRRRKRDFQNERLGLLVVKSGKCICFKLCILKASRWLLTEFSLKWNFRTSECVCMYVSVHACMCVYRVRMCARWRPGNRAHFSVPDWFITLVHFDCYVLLNCFYYLSYTVSFIAKVDLFGYKK